MNYFRCGGSEKVTIDGEKVRDKMELVTQNADILMLNNNIQLPSPKAVVLDDEIHIITNNRKHYKWIGHIEFVDDCPWSGDNIYGAVELNGEIYVAVYNNSAPMLYKWDGAWTQVAQMPYGCVSMVVFNDEICILGSTNSTYNQSYHRWNGNTWLGLGQLPFALSSGGHAVVLDNEIYIAGGSSAPQRFYKKSGGVWTQLSKIPYSFAQGGMVVLNGEIHILGGANVQGGTQGNAYKHYKWNANGWSTTGETIVRGSIFYSGEDYGRALGYKIGAIVLYKNNIYLIGGSDDDTKYITIIDATLYQQK